MQKQHMNSKASLPHETACGIALCVLGLLSGVMSKPSRARVGRAQRLPSEERLRQQGLHRQGKDSF